jgi:hypothetical protein
MLKVSKTPSLEVALVNSNMDRSEMKLKQLKMTGIAVQ